MQKISYRRYQNYHFIFYISYANYEFVAMFIIGFNTYLYYV